MAVFLSGNLTKLNDLPKAGSGTGAVTAVFLALSGSIPPSGSRRKTPKELRTETGGMSRRISRPSTVLATAIGVFRAQIW
jgi:hypothetical protein